MSIAVKFLLAFYIYVCILICIRIEQQREISALIFFCVYLNVCFYIYLFSFKLIRSRVIWLQAKHLWANIQQLFLAPKGFFILIIFTTKICVYNNWASVLFIFFFFFLLFLFFPSFSFLFPLFFSFLSFSVSFFIYFFSFFVSETNENWFYVNDIWHFFLFKFIFRNHFFLFCDISRCDCLFTHIFVMKAVYFWVSWFMLWKSLIR